MKKNASVLVTLLALCPVSSAFAGWQANEPCFGKEGVAGSCLNRLSTPAPKQTNPAKEDCAVPTSPASTQAVSTNSRKLVASNLR
jgi:hypothetical protein